jgi:hypothetical protein
MGEGSRGTTELESVIQAEAAANVRSLFSLWRVPGKRVNLRRADVS